MLGRGCTCVPFIGGASRRPTRAIPPRPDVRIHAAAPAFLGATERRVRARPALAVDAAQLNDAAEVFAPRRLPELVLSLLRDGPSEEPSTPGCWVSPRETPFVPEVERFIHRVRRSERQPCQRLAIGSRQSRPNARGRSFTPGGAWRRLYSARSTRASTLSTVVASNSARSSSRERSSST